MALGLLLILGACSGGSESGSSGGELFQTKTTSNSFALELPSNKTYSEGETLDFVLSHSQRVTVTGSPRLTINLGGSTVYANYLAGSGTRNLTFRYSISSSDSDLDGIELTNQIDLNGGTLEYSFNGATEDANINFTVGNTSGILVDTPVEGPGITNFIEPVDGTYADGGSLLFQVDFENAVDVSGSPQIILDIGGVTRYASYTSGTGTSSLNLFLHCRRFR